jgi:hypothetical protein
MTIRDQQRLTLLAGAAILSGLAGCSMFQERPEPKISSEVMADSGAPKPPAGPKYVIEMRPDKGKGQVTERTLNEPTHMQAALEATGAAKKFKRAIVEVYRPLPKGGWHKMTLEFDNPNHRVPPEYDYAILPGDRIVVREDPSGFLDDLTSRALEPLGVPLPKKQNQLAKKYQVQG